MKDLTEKQYLKLKPLYWVVRAGTNHPNCEEGEIILSPPLLSLQKPNRHYMHLRDPECFQDFKNDLTYAELNNHNKLTWNNLQKGQSWNYWE